MPKDVTVEVTRNVDLGHGNFLLEFAAPHIAAATEPGQFFMIGIPGSEILLRRPFCVCGLPGTFAESPPGAVQLLCKIVGRGTSLMASLKPGATLDVLGPLGRGFDTVVAAGVSPVLVAGGIGSAPFPALAAALSRGGARPRMLYGAGTAEDLPLLDWFREHCEIVSVATEDGSLGFKGLVTELLEKELARAGARVRLYGCGPEPMLRAMARMTRERGVPCELSLEAQMACGFGVCLGCVVATRTGGEVGYERVCVEGPVMDAEKLAW